MMESKGGVLSSLAGNVAVFVLVTVALNGVIFGMGWDRQSATAMRGIPPGWVVGSLWVVLFAGMGAARWLLVRSNIRSSSPRWVAELPSLLAFLCLIYPLYTSGLNNERVGLIGNVVTALVALPMVVVVWRRSRGAAGCMAAVCVWLLYAGAATGLAVYR